MQRKVPSLISAEFIFNMSWPTRDKDSNFFEKEIQNRLLEAVPGEESQDEVMNILDMRSSKISSALKA